MFSFTELCFSLPFTDGETYQIKSKLSIGESRNLFKATLSDEEMESIKAVVVKVGYIFCLSYSKFGVNHLSLISLVLSNFFVQF